MTALALDQLHPLDRALVSTLPVLPVLRHGRMPELAIGQRRLLVSSNATLLEVRSAVLHACLPIGKLGLATPFGHIEPFVRLTYGPIPRSMFTTMIWAAAEAHPNEAVRLVHSIGGKYRLSEPMNTQAGVGQVSYLDSLDDERLVLDVHSHGPYPAYFSSTDDASDLSRPGPYLAIVFGQCESPASVQVVARLCSGPFLIPIDLAAHALIEVPQ